MNRGQRYTRVAAAAVILYGEYATGLVETVAFTSVVVDKRCLAKYTAAIHNTVGHTCNVNRTI